MSNSLNRCTLHPGWVKPFLAAIKNGYSERNAANMSGVGTLTIHQREDKSPEFKAQYAETLAKQKPRYGHGAW